MKFYDFAGMRLLRWFLGNPTRKIHFKQLCRELALSPLTVKTYCDEFVRRGWLQEERSANLRIFSIDNDHYLIKSFKRAFVLELLCREKIGNAVDDGIISLALFGSHASGEYDEKSDIDLIVVGRREQVHHDLVKRLEKKLRKQVQVTLFPLEEWERRKKDDPFALSVLRTHVLLKGVPL